MKSSLSVNSIDKGTIIELSGNEISRSEYNKDTEELKVSSGIWIGGLKESYPYTGKAIKPAINVYDGIKLLKEKTDYTLSYSSNKNVGTGWITVKFKGNYGKTESVKVSFEIINPENEDPGIPLRSDKKDISGKGRHEGKSRKNGRDNPAGGPARRPPNLRAHQEQSARTHCAPAGRHRAQYRPIHRRVRGVSSRRLRLVFRPS